MLMCQIRLLYSDMLSMAAVQAHSEAVSFVQLVQDQNNEQMLATHSLLISTSLHDPIFVWAFQSRPAYRGQSVMACLKIEVVSFQP
jgi:hypothetical protein